MEKLQIKLGDKYNKLTIIKKVNSYISPSGNKKRQFECICDCGNIITIRLSSIKSGNTTSCGCSKKELIKERNLTHGLTKNKLYHTWYGMKKRCYNTNSINYKYYGGRGITICDRWLGVDGFKNFLEDMGQRPIGTSIDRINVNGNYELSNCRWATPKQQLNNRR
jgi:hypothetical protein